MYAARGNSGGSTSDWRPKSNICRRLQQRMAESPGEMAYINDTESDDDVGAVSNANVVAGAAGGEKQKAQTQTSSLHTDNLDAKKHERMQRNKQHAKKSRDNTKKHMHFLEQQVVLLSKQTHILHLRLEHVENKLVLGRLL